MMIFAPSEAALEAAASPERQEPTPRMREHSAAWGSRAAAHGVTGAIFHHRAREHTQHCRLRAGAAKRRGAERRAGAGATLSSIVNDMSRADALAPDPAGAMPLSVPPALSAPEPMLNLPTSHDINPMAAMPFPVPVLSPASASAPPAPSAAAEPMISVPSVPSLSKLSDADSGAPGRNWAPRTAARRTTHTALNCARSAGRTWNNFLESDGSTEAVRGAPPFGRRHHRRLVALRPPGDDRRVTFSPSLLRHA
jgi:hypothetical protein